MNSIISYQNVVVKTNNNNNYYLFIFKCWGDFDKCGGDIDGGDFAVGRFDQVPVETVWTYN